MKKWILQGLLAMLLLIASTSLNAMIWVKCATHDHSKEGSDGTIEYREMVHKASTKGFKVILLSDHLEKILVQCGYEAYIALCNAGYEITVIPGVEVTIGSSHTIVYGELTVEALKALAKAKTLSEVFATAEDFGLFTVAAHAYQNAYPYDPKNILDVNGEEWLNDTAKNFNYYIDLGIAFEKMGKEVFFWAGQDSHMIIDPQDKERWQRVTWVYAESASRDDVLEAMSEGRTYAATQGFSLSSITPLPGFETHEGEPRLQFEVRSLKKTEKDYRIKIYRGSELVFSTTMKKGNLTKQVDFLDRKVTLGTKKYLIVTDPVMAVTPILIDVAETPKDKAVDVILPKGPLTLLKKSRAEVDEVLGEKYRTLDSPGNYRLYEGNPSVTYNTCITFRPNIAGLSAMKEWNNVWAEVVKPNLEIKSTSAGLSASSVVPAAILKTKPFGTYATLIDNVVATVWYINHQTFLLLRSSNAPLMTTVRPRYGRPTYVANKNTRNLSVGWVYQFGCVDKIAKIEVSRDDYGGPDNHMICIDPIPHSEFALFNFQKK